MPLHGLAAFFGVVMLSGFTAHTSAPTCPFLPGLLSQTALADLCLASRLALFSPAPGAISPGLHAVQAAASGSAALATSCLGRFFAASSPLAKTFCLQK